MKSFSLIFVTIALLGAGCATEQVAPLNTPSGRPEIVIRGTMEKVRSKLITENVGRAGWTLVKQTDNVVVFSSLMTTFTAGLLYGTEFGGNPYYRATYTLVPNGAGSVRIFLSADVVSNYGSAFERAHSADNPRWRQAAQKELATLKVQVESGS